jgi:hypothetical protein
MKKNLMKTALALAPAALVMFFTGCTNEELVSEQVRQYEKNFTETFGEIDPTHDWSMATPVTANIDLSNAPEGTYEVKIYSEKNGYLLKKAIVDGSAKLHFDAIKGENSVRVLARKTSALGLTPINGYFPVENGVVNTAKGTRASTADNCQTTVGSQIDLGSKSMQVSSPTYQASNGNYYYDVSSLPTDVDGRYYISTIEGADYSEGGSGKYKVKQAKNGQIVDLPDMDMYEVGSIVYPNGNNWEKGNFLMYKMTSDGQYSLAGGDCVTPACYATTTSEQNVKWAGDLYLLNDVYKSVDQKTQMPFEDLLPLVSSAYENPYFHETDDNRTKWEDDLDFNVELVLTEDGPMTYTYVFYGSIYHNMLGYFYWFEEEGMTDAEIKAARIAAPKYVLMNDTYPTIENPETGGKPNLQCYSDENGTDPHTPDGMQMPTWVDTGIEAHTGHYLQGTTYHMTYFGENYNQPASYTFPKGAHVAFFLITKATANSTNNNGTNQNNKGTGLFYSIQDMNEDQEIFLNGDGEKCFLNDKHWWASEVNGEYNSGEERPDQGEVAAVFYNYKGSMVLGFEDDVDKDENDMLFFVSAPINPPHEITEQTDVEMSWVVACEDLGGSYDYDFNDIVFDLGQVDVTYITTTDEAGTTTSSTSVEKSELYLRPLAAGGTRKAYIYYDGENLGEIHDLLRKGAPSNVPINVGGSWDVDPTKVERIKLADIDLTNYDSSTTPEQYVSNVKAYVAQELQKIKIVVDNEGQKEATEVTAPREDGTNIPQMLLLPRGWDWPNEMVSIFNVYPNFKSWTLDKEKNGWITTPVGSYHTNPIK